MEEYEIKQSVERQVNNWKVYHRRNGIDIQLSQNAINFITELIKNIENDPSEFWRKQNNYDSYQQEAIEKIAESLSSIIEKDENLRNLGYNNEIMISTWELWSHLSEILTGFCFIPRKRMNGR